MNATPVNACLSCGSHDLEEILDLGNQPLANNLLNEEDLGKDEPRFPLGIQVCRKCWLVQLTRLVPPVDLFSEYLYFSSFSETMLWHASEAVSHYTESLKLDSTSFVVEVASNDGYLLKNFVQNEIPCLGVEPAGNIAEEARKEGVPTLEAFFGEETAREIRAEHGAADLILGNNVFAHVPDINDFISGIRVLLSPEGIAVLEFPYLVDLIGKLEFDTIYHEHVFYFSVIPLVEAFKRHGLEIFDVERLTIHGGSIRIFIGAEGRKIATDRFRATLAEEEQVGTDSPSFYRDFGERVAKLTRSLESRLRSLAEEPGELAAYGAAAKGSTLLNALDLDRDLLAFVVDRSPYKQGRYTPGLHLPILPVEALMEKDPSYTLVLAWNFLDEIMEQQSDYRDRGGQFVVPVPEVRVL